MIDKSFIEGLAALVSKSEAPKMINITDDMAIGSVNGETRTYNLPPPRRNHLAEDLETIFAFAMQNPCSSVWYNCDGVVVLAHDEDRRDRMTMPLYFSPQLKMLQLWEEKGQAGYQLKQREAILLLRTVFKNCLRNHDTLIASMRAMKSSIGGSGESKIEQGKRSIDKRLEHQWTGADGIPECITLNVPVFDSRFHFEADIEVAIDANAENETFTFIPIPGSIVLAIEEAEHKIGEHLRTLLIDKQMIYYGSPNY